MPYDLPSITEKMSEKIICCLRGSKKQWYVFTAAFARRAQSVQRNPHQYEVICVLLRPMSILWGSIHFSDSLQDD
jgi:hypothetical protein